MKKLLLLLLFFTTFFSSKSANEWILYLENEKIKIEFKYVDCDYKQEETSFIGGFNREYVFLKITNLSNEKINIDWELELWYENTC